MTIDKTVNQLTGRVAVLEALLAHTIPCIGGKLTTIDLITNFQEDFRKSPAFCNLNPGEQQTAEEMIKRVFNPAMQKLATVRK